MQALFSTLWLTVAVMSTTKAVGTSGWQRRHGIGLSFTGNTSSSWHC
jgi:hypothetical protein